METYIQKDENGSKFYYRDEKMTTLHKEDGPAMIWEDGTKAWYRDGVLHREDGPAVEYADGNRSWYHHGKLHRAGGPALELTDEEDEYYVHGNHYTRDEYRSWYFEYLRQNTPIEDWPF